MAMTASFREAFLSEGHELWLVGGAVRDAVLGVEGADDDYATDALPDEVARIAASTGAAVNLIGQRFGTVGVLLDGRWSEVTTFRGDSYEGGTRWPDVTFGSSIQEDLARRDFTVNAMAVNAHSGESLDPHGGKRDLEARLLRAVGEPATRFREDPLRILRGMRLASQLDFDVEPGTRAGMDETAGLLSTLSQERITAELDRLLGGIAPGRGLELLHGTGALQVVLPEAAPMVGCEQNRWHSFDVWGHAVATVTGIETGDATRVRRWAAFLHDLGKPPVRHTKANGEWGFFRHETVGAEMAVALLERLKVSRRDSNVIALLVRRHMDRPNAEDAKSVRRFMRRVEGHWRDLLALKRADNASHTYDDSSYHDGLQQQCERIERDEAERLRAQSPLTGDELVEIFDREPGPWIRRVKERLSGMVLDGDLAPGDREGAALVARSLLGPPAKP